MTTTSILAVPGLSKTSSGFRRELAALADRHDWDADAIAAVMSFESAKTFAADAGWQSWQPTRTATGLLQFIESTARSLGVPTSSRSPHSDVNVRGAGKAWATWSLMKQSPTGQLALVERFFERGFGGFKPTRPVDYYLVVFGQRPGLPLSTVLHARGSAEYEANRLLDRDNDGQITVQDLDRAIAGPLSAQARLEVPQGPGIVEVALLLGLSFGWPLLRKAFRS